MTDQSALQRVIGLLLLAFIIILVVFFWGNIRAKVSSAIFGLSGGGEEVTIKANSWESLKIGKEEYQFQRYQEDAVLIKGAKNKDPFICGYSEVSKIAQLNIDSFKRCCSDSSVPVCVQLKEGQIPSTQNELVILASSR